MKNSKLKFSEYMQNISRSKSFGKFVLIVYVIRNKQYCVVSRFDDLFGGSLIKSFPTTTKV